MNDRVREALGDTFYEEFMVSALYFSVGIRQLKPTVNVFEKALYNPNRNLVW